MSYERMYFEGKDYGLDGLVLTADVGHGEIVGQVHRYPDEMPKSLQIAIDDWWSDAVVDAVEKWQDQEAATRDDEAYHLAAEGG